MKPAKPVEIVQYSMKAISSSASAEKAMAALEPLLSPEIEWVNPHDAIEGGTRRGLAGIQLVLDNFFAGAGAASTAVVETMEDRGDRVLAVYRLHIRGESSGADVVGPQTGMVFTIREGQILRIEWHYDIAEARARFGAAPKG